MRACCHTLQACSHMAALGTAWPPFTYVNGTLLRSLRTHQLREVEATSVGWTLPALGVSLPPGVACQLSSPFKEGLDRSCCQKASYTHAHVHQILIRPLAELVEWSQAGRILPEYSNAHKDYVALSTLL